MTQGHGWKNNLLGAGGDQDLLTHIYGNRLVCSYSFHSKMDYRAPLSAVRENCNLPPHFYFWDKNLFFSPKNDQKFCGAPYTHLHLSTGISGIFLKSSL